MDNHIELSLADALFTRSALTETIGVAAFFGGDLPDVEELRARVAERWGGQTRLKLVLHRAQSSFRSPNGPTHWAVAERFDPTAHVHPATDLAAMDTRDHARRFDEWIAAQLLTPMPDDMPPWRLLLLRGAAGSGFVLVLLAHHALLDGASLATLMELLLDGTTRTPCTAHTAPPRAPRQPFDWPGLARTLRPELRRAGSLPAPRGASTPEVAVVNLDREILRAASDRPGSAGTPLSELLLCSATGALQHVFALDGPHARPGAAPVHVTIPVNLRTRATATHLGNLGTAARLPLPPSTPHPHLRLTACSRLLADLRARARQGELLNVKRTVERAADLLGPWAVTALAKRAFSPAYAAVSVTTLKWRHPQRALGRRPLLRIAGLPPVHQPGTVNFLAVSHRSFSTLTVVSHTGRDAAQALADRVREELRMLADH